MMIIDGAGPEPDRLDRRGIRPVLALCREFGLMSVDPGLMIGAVDAWNAIQRVVLRHRRADKTAVEDVGAADRGAVRLRRRVRLAAIESPAGLEQIRVARNVVVARLAPVSVGMNGKIAAARIHQNAA